MSFNDYKNIYLQKPTVSFLSYYTLQMMQSRKIFYILKRIHTIIIKNRAKSTIRFSTFI